MLLRFLFCFSDDYYYCVSSMAFLDFYLLFFCFRKAGQAADKQARNDIAEDAPQRLDPVNEKWTYRGFPSQQAEDDQEYRKAWIATEHATLQQQTADFQRVVNDAVTVDAQRSEADAAARDREARQAAEALHQEMERLQSERELARLQ